MAADLVDDKACPTTGVTEITFEDTVGATGSNADKAVLKTECMDACVSERSNTTISYCCQADMTPDAVDAPTTFTSTCKLWSFDGEVTEPTDKATDDTTGVQCAAANILSVTEETTTEGSIKLAVSVVTTMAISMLMY
jgi:hypothetical protein